MLVNVIRWAKWQCRSASASVISDSFLVLLYLHADSFSPALSLYVFVSQHSVTVHLRLADSPRLPPKVAAQLLVKRRRRSLSLLGGRELTEDLSLKQVDPSSASQ